MIKYQMRKGKLILLPDKQDKKILIYGSHGEPLVVKGNRIGFQMRTPSIRGI